ncbi:hypothetical protein OO256_26710 [Pseudomonas sp. DCB_CB]|uniref:hypothetical protein n=1 Tax=unclassified Pseudomonas TaxID=196821 RepID=UPI0022495E71|nr:MULTISPECIES: hypothetical protein [unclassified Pseudomonas]MCX2694493.1 hypothetical protein [Pseudomonas sp. DCB_BZ]MCX2859677.1 hypothetical protein [Pseudomonas sp. DCB_CB]
MNDSSNIEVSVLPPADTPKQLTARSVISSLGEHWVAFLAANNITGWAEDADYILREDRIVDIVLTVGSSTGLYLGQLKRQASLIKKLSAASGGNLKIAHINEIIAKALGYKNYYMAYKCRSVDNFVQNVWPSGVALSLDIVDAESLNSSRHSSVVSALVANYRFNKERDKLANTSKIMRAEQHKKKISKRTNKIEFR